VTGEASLESRETHQMISSTSTSELSYRVLGLIVGMFLSKLDLKLSSLLAWRQPARVAILSGQFDPHSFGRANCSTNIP
jgi:hypothetical protein